MSVFDSLPEINHSIDGTWSAIIANNPTTITDPVYVTIPSWDANSRIGPCRWITRGTILPTRGKECLVEFDERQRPTVIAWWDGTNGLAGLASVPVVGTSPPGSPSDGDIWIYRDVEKCTNPGFETNLTGWVTNNNWGGGAGSPVQVRDTSIFHSGIASNKLTNSVSNSDSGTAFSFSGLTLGTYRLVGWYNCTAFTAGAFGNRGMGIYDPSAGGNTFVNTSLTGTSGGWKRFELLTVCCTGNLEARLYALNGTVYWDDISLIREVDWTFHYNASDPSAYPWRFAGGSPMRCEIDNSETTNSTTFVDLATPQGITIPRDGEYIGEWNLIGQNNVLTALDVIALVNQNGGGQAARQDIHETVAGALLSLSASQVFGALATDPIKLQFATSSNAHTGTFQKRRMYITPVRVK